MKFSKTMTNAEIAAVFRAIAAVYTVKEVESFRTQAYVSAASSIEQYTLPLHEVWEAGKLEDVPGIGQKFAKYLNELFSTGHIKRLEKILASEPAGMFALLDVPGLGPKTAYKLAIEFQLNDAETAAKKLLAAAKAGKIAQLEGFTEISERKIQQGLEQHLLPREKRLLLPVAEQIALEVIEYLRKSPMVEDAEVLGSLRRRVPTVGDIDIAVKTSKPEVVMEHVQAFPHVAKIISTGPKTTMFKHQSGYQVDVKTQVAEAWGSMLQHYTGSKLHNIHLRTDALEKGMSLSEHGIKKGEKLLTFRDEETFYKQLGLQWIPPELREDVGEIEAARQGKLPMLVELSDIKGDVHVHTDIPFPSSHDSGASSVAELLTAAMELGYEFIGFADHNPKQSDLSAAERLTAVRERNAAIDKAVAAFGKHHHNVPQVFKGLEVDILSDGRLALEDEALAQLDYVIASVHAGFGQSREITTKRLLTALAHPKVRILGHPTGRRIPDRPEIDCDWDQIFVYAAQHDKYLEVNSSPDRLDLPSPLIQRAIAAGVKLFINTDTHNAAGLQMMKYGVWTARRGWATKKDVGNARVWTP